MTTITIPGREMRECVKGLLKVIPRKSSLPILNSVLFRAEAGKVTAVATSLDDYALFTFKDARADGNGIAAVGIEHLKSICGGDTATLEIAPKRITAAFEKNGQRLARSFEPVDCSEFPAMPQEARTHPAPGWSESYARLVPFTSTDQTRYVLQGIYTEVSAKGKIVMVATDGRRLTLYEQDYKLPRVKSFITPVKRFLTAMRPDGDVALGCSDEKDGGWVTIKSGQWDYRVRSIAGTFPNFRQVIPAPPARCNTITIEASDDMPALLKYMPGNKGDAIILNRFGKCGLVITVPKNSDQDADTVIKMRSSTFRGPDKALSVGRDYLLDALRADFSVFRAEDSLTPLLSVDGQSGMHVLMPVRLPDVMQNQKAA